MKIYISKLGRGLRWYHITTTLMALALLIFALYLHMYHYEGLIVTPLDAILAPIIIVSMECYIFCKLMHELLSAFNILVVKGGSITYIDARGGYGNLEYKEKILSRNKNRTIEVSGTLFIQILNVHGIDTGDRSYILIGTQPPFDGNKFICDSNQIIMRESSVFVPALKESFDCVELEPVFKNIEEIL